MSIRYYAAAPLGILVTTSLLWVMNFLIEESEFKVDDSGPRTTLEFVRVITVSKIKTREEQPKPPIDPVRPPPLTPLTNSSTNSIPVGIPSFPIAPGEPTPRKLQSGPMNGALVTILTPQPTYPVKAAAKGLEGYVVVQFDVTSAGTVDSVVVTETSNTLFNKAAVNAAYRARYRPQVVDGVAQRTPGVQKVFRFEMEQ